MQIRSRRPRVVPACPPGPLLGGVEEQLAIDGVGDVPLERPDRLSLGLAFGHLLLEVGPTVRVRLSDLADGHHVDRMVELAVAPTAQPVDSPTARRQLDWRDAGIGGELVPTREPTDVTRVADELTGQDRAHAIEIGERGARRLDSRPDPLV